MSGTLPVILLTVIGFLAVVLSLGAGKGVNGKITGVCIAAALTTGIVFYGYGYSYHEGFSLTAVIKTLLMVCRMFSGGCDYSVVGDTPLFGNGWAVALFWIGHFSAFYMTASAAVRLLGRRLLKKLRIRMLRVGDIRLVYGAEPDTLCLIGDREKNHPLILVTERSDEAVSARADSLGAVEFEGGAALCADTRFLKTIGTRGSRRKLDVCCIGSDPVGNLRYAETLLPALRERKVPPEALSLFILGVPEERASRLLALDGRYGYGELYSASRYELTARLAVEKCPPWSFIRCDSAGRAQNDFRVFLVGFGRMGQAMLREMIVNGQMEGSAFHAEVFDRRMNEERGFFEALYPSLLKNYDVALYEAAANSKLFHEHLESNPPAVIVLCSGDAGYNMELGGILYRKYGSRPDRPRVIQCSPDSVLVDEKEYRPGYPDVRKADRAAMELNHILRGGASAAEDWKECDPLSRADCRAAVRFFPAHLHAAGVSLGEAAAGKWPPPPETLENLSRTEHRRWRAFRHALGCETMDGAELEQRCARFRRGETGSITDNTAAGTHACLVPWEELDDLSRRIKDAAGISEDFKAPYRKNVLAVPGVLRKEDPDQPV